MKDMTITQKLAKIQASLKAPKDLYNSFGKYKYRNFESICEAVKPLLTELECCLTLSDSIVQVGERYYIKAIAELRDENGAIHASAYAREALDKKGMDDSQITGTASSYARKYACNGLFLLDDTKDADTDEYHQQTHSRASKKSELTPAQLMAVRNALKETGSTEEGFCKYFQIGSLNELTSEQYMKAMNMFASQKGKS